MASLSSSVVEVSYTLVSFMLQISWDELPITNRCCKSMLVLSWVFVLKKFTLFLNNPSTGFWCGCNWMYPILHVVVLCLCVLSEHLVSGSLYTDGSCIGLGWSGSDSMIFINACTYSKFYFIYLNASRRSNKYIYITDLFN